MYQDSSNVLVFFVLLCFFLKILFPLEVFHKVLHPSNQILANGLDGYTVWLWHDGMMVCDRYAPAAPEPKWLKILTANATDTAWQLLFATWGSDWEAGKEEVECQSNSKEDDFWKAIQKQWHSSAYPAFIRIFWWWFLVWGFDARSRLSRHNNCWVSRISRNK